MFTNNVLAKIIVRVSMCNYSLLDNAVHGSYTLEIYQESWYVLLLLFLSLSVFIEGKNFTCFELD